MATITKNSNGVVIYTSDETVHALQPNMNVFSHPEHSEYVIITDDANPNETRTGLQIIWQNVTNIEAQSRGEFIQKLADLFFFSNANIIWLINDTGAETVKGTIVTTSSAFKSVKTNVANIPNPVAIMAASGIPNGQPCPVIVSGAAQVLLQDNTAATAGYWVKVSDTQNGRADASNQFPPGGTIVAIEDHLSEIGHCLESVSPGTNKLCWVILHFN